MVEAAGRKIKRNSPKKRRWRRTPPPEKTPTTQEWLDIARKVLIERGISEVKIDKIAKIAGVTRGGFYWRFKGRNDLLAALLEDWRISNTAPLLRALKGDGSPVTRMRIFVDVLIEEKDFNPRYDSAIRNWAQASPMVANVLREVDDQRIEALTQVFLEADYPPDEAFIRARISYFHQVGYYAVGVRETKGRRRDLSTIYTRILTGWR